MTNNKVIEKFLLNESKAKNSTKSLILESGILYSYGTHYVLAKRVNPNTIEVNCKKVSITTSKQRNMVFNAAKSKGLKVILVNDLK